MSIAITISERHKLDQNDLTIPIQVSANHKLDQNDLVVPIVVTQNHKLRQTDFPIIGGGQGTFDESFDETFG